MKSSIAKGLLASLFLNVCLMTTAPAATVTLFTDDFSYATTGTTNNPTTSAWTSPYKGYSQTASAFSAAGTVKLGTSSVLGSLTTTNLKMQAGTIYIQVKGVGWSSTEKTLVISVDSQEVKTHTFTALRGVPFELVSVEAPVSDGNHTVKFASTTYDLRCLLDDILITQEVTENVLQPEFAVTGAPSSVEEMSPISFTVSANVAGNPTNVTCSTTLPTGASYVFANSEGTFNWTPALGQAGAYEFVFSANGSDGQPYTTTVNITVNTLPLTAPTGLAASSIAYNAFDASWSPVAAATQGYRVTVWTGSSATNTPTADVETFFETTDNNPVQPYGWTFTGITLEYMDKGLNEVSFDTTGDSIVTRLYPKAVTALSFRIQGRTTSSTSNSVLTVSGSADGTTWTSLASYSTLSDSDGNDENNIFSTTGGDLEKHIAIESASGYRQFKFVYTKDKGNVGIGNIAAAYEGAGTKFVAGWYNTAVADTDISVGGLRAARNYYVLVCAKNSTETKSSMLSLRTLEAPRATVIVVR